MALTVELYAYSGHANPRWTLDARQEQEFRAMVGLDVTVAVRDDRLKRGSLGYSGFRVSGTADGEIHPLDMRIFDGRVQDVAWTSARELPDRTAESWLLGTAESILPAVVHVHVARVLTGSSREGVATPVEGPCPTCRADQAPPYDPDRWADPDVELHNNCYNYANDRIGDKPLGIPERSECICAKLIERAEADGLRRVSDFSQTISRGHYVALAVWPDVTFHWYRQDANGCWSHKDGKLAVSNTDTRGRRIVDPATCERGPYTAFCGYMVTNPDVMIS